MAGASVQEDESTFTGPTFSPPVYSQRYRFALDTAARINARKVSETNIYSMHTLEIMKKLTLHLVGCGHGLR